MPQIKTLARESHFLAFIFSKILILFSKKHIALLRVFYKNFSLISSKAKIIFPI